MKMAKKKTTNPRRTSKDFCTKWARLFRLEFGFAYKINWAGEGSVFRSLMSDFTGAQLTEIVEFAFSGHPATDYLRSNGFAIRLLPSQINKFITAMKTPQRLVPEEDLELDIPYWDDSRTAYIWSHVKRGDLDPLIRNITDDYYWALLLAKLERQNGFIPEKVELYFEHWKMKIGFKRTAIRHET